jgi:hypothetical protein
MSTTDRNKPARNDQLRQVAAGVHKHYPNVALMLAGQNFVPPALEQAIQSDIAATDATERARAQWLALVQAERDSHRKLAPVLRALRATVFGQFGDTADATAILADFGYAPRKVTKTTAVTKAGAATKSTATRAARRTMGSVQKKAVTGGVTGIVVTPITASKAEAPAATVPSAPASPAPAATAPAGTSPQASPASPSH